LAAWKQDVVLAHICQFVSVPPLARYLSGPHALYLQEPYRFLYEAAPELPWLSESVDGGGVLNQVRRFLGSSIRMQPHRVQAREELISARAFQTIFVNSYFSRESVRRAYGLDSSVMYLGIDSQRFT